MSIARKIKVRADLFLFGEVEGKTVATVMAGYEGHRGAAKSSGGRLDHEKNVYGRETIAEGERPLLTDRIFTGRGHNLRLSSTCNQKQIRLASTALSEISLKNDSAARERLDDGGGVRHEKQLKP
jgi:hypothetical protein